MFSSVNSQRQVKSCSLARERKLTTKTTKSPNTSNLSQIIWGEGDFLLLKSWNTESAPKASFLRGEKRLSLGSWGRKINLVLRKETGGVGETREERVPQTLQTT